MNFLSPDRQRLSRYHRGPEIKWNREEKMPMESLHPSPEGRGHSLKLARGDLRTKRGSISLL